MGAVGPASQLRDARVGEQGARGQHRHHRLLQRDCEGDGALLRRPTADVGEEVRDDPGLVRQQHLRRSEADDHLRPEGGDEPERTVHQQLKGTR